MNYKIVDISATGHINQNLIKTIKRLLSCQVGGKKFFIGKTGRDPRDRFREHLRENPKKWKKMILLYASKSKKHVEDLEYYLVYTTYEKNTNCTGGGGGPLSEKHPTNYVYVLI